MPYSTGSIRNIKKWQLLRQFYAASCRSTIVLFYTKSCYEYVNILGSSLLLLYDYTDTTRDGLLNKVFGENGFLRGRGSSTPTSSTTAAVNDLNVDGVPIQGATPAGSNPCS